MYLQVLEAHREHENLTLKCETELGAAIAAVDAHVGEVEDQLANISKQVSHLQSSVLSVIRPMEAAQVSTSAGRKHQERPFSGRGLGFVKLGFSDSISSVIEACQQWFVGLSGFPTPAKLRDTAKQQNLPISMASRTAYAHRKHLPLAVQRLAQQSGMSFATTMGVFQQVQQEHNLTLAEVRDGCRLAFPGRDPTAHGGPQRKATLIHRGPNKAAITVQQFTAWVTDKGCAL